MASLAAIARRAREGLRPARGDSQMRVRLVFAMAVFVGVYGVIAGQLAILAVTPEREVVRHLGPGESVSHARPNLLDRSGTVLATDIMVPSVYAEPHRIIDVDEAIENIVSVFPDLDAAELRRRLTNERRFAWVKREITPRERDRLHRLGIPGIGFVEETQRFYPARQITSHVLGHVNIDNQGIAGLERHLDESWLGALHEAGLARFEPPAPVRTTLDLRAQHAMRDELLVAMERFHAIAAAGVILDVRSGEVVSMVSLPDYDPHDPRQALEDDKINRVTTGVYELGSTFKAFTVAMGLDSGKFSMGSTFDARSPIRAGGFSIDDFRGKRRILDTAEVFIYSSNIGTARMALAVGADDHKEFLSRLGFFDRLTTELPESALPIVPSRWPDLTAMTVSFGHGISVSPMHAVMAGAALVNGGKLIRPTFFPRSREEAAASARQVLMPETSEHMRHMMRLNVVSGTARQADAKGYRVGGKTGTAEKVVDGRYTGQSVLTSFLGVFPTDDPQYLILVMLDEPKGIQETHGFRTSGWNAAPTTARVVERIAPILGVRPVLETGDGVQPLSASY
jgi:cell division protein FtsI (penicillin-binding protein 3)